MTPQEKATIQFAYYAFTMLVALLVYCAHYNNVSLTEWIKPAIMLVLSWFFSRSLRSNKPNPEPPPGGSVTVNGAPKPADNG